MASSHLRMTSVIYLLVSMSLLSIIFYLLHLSSSYHIYCLSHIIYHLLSSLWLSSFFYNVFVYHLLSIRYLCINIQFHSSGIYLSIFNFSFVNLPVYHFSLSLHVTILTNYFPLFLSFYIYISK